MRDISFKSPIPTNILASSGIPIESTRLLAIFWSPGLSRWNVNNKSHFTAMSGFLQYSDPYLKEHQWRFSVVMMN